MVDYPKQRLGEESAVSTLHANNKILAHKSPRNIWLVCTEALDTLMLLGGIMIVLGAIILMPTHTGQIVGAAVGLLMVEASAWGSTRRLLPGQRKYKPLRVEVDHFLGLIKQLNSTALTAKAYEDPEAQQAFEQACEDLQRSVNRMIAVAGKTESELAAKTLGQAMPTQPLDNRSVADKTE